MRESVCKQLQNSKLRFVRTDIFVDFFSSVRIFVAKQLKFVRIFIAQRFEYYAKGGFSFSKCRVLFVQIVAEFFFLCGWIKSILNNHFFINFYSINSIHRQQTLRIYADLIALLTCTVLTIGNSLGVPDNHS